MDKDSEDFEKKFSEIIKSDELKEISDSFKKESVFTFKELILVQQSLMESLTYISDIIFYHVQEQEDLINISGNIYHNMISALYKISVDFNDVMIEYLEENLEEDLGDSDLDE